MGYMTTITILNDALDQIKKYPKEFVDNVLNGVNGIDKFGKRENKLINSYGVGNYANPIEVAKSHHADESRLYLVYQNMMVSLGYNDDITDYDLRKKLLKEAKFLIKEEEQRIKKLKE